MIAKLQAILVIPILALCVSRAQADYTFSKITDTNVNFSLFAPYINNQGQVAFWGNNNANFNYINRWDSVTNTSTNVATATLQSTGSNFETFGARVSMNNQGQVAYTRLQSNFAGSTYSLNVRSGSTTQTYLSLPGTQISDSTISDSGQIAYSQTNLGTPRTSNAFTVSSTGVTQNFGQTVSPLPSINATNTVAFQGRGDTIQVGSSPSTLQSITLPQFFINPAIAINDSGNIAFTALDNGSTVSRSSVYLLTQGSSTPTVLASGADFQSLASSAVSLNSLNNVLFLGTPSNGLSGLFSTALGLQNPIISVGDSLDGSIVTELSLSRHALNDSLDITFLATLQDGRTGLYYGKITAVPEPHSILLLGGAGLWIVRRCTAITKKKRFHKGSRSS